MTDHGRNETGTIAKLQYFTTLRRSQHQHLELFHIANPAKKLFLGPYHLNYLFRFAKLPKFPLIYLTTDTAPSVAEAKYARRSSFHQVCYNCDGFPGWGETNLPFPGTPFLCFAKFLNEIPPSHEIYAIYPNGYHIVFRVHPTRSGPKIISF